MISGKGYALGITGRTFLNTAIVMSLHSLISDSFYEKAELEQFVRPAIDRADYKEAFDPIWHLLVEQGLSFVVKSADKETLGVCLNFDLNDEPEVEMSPGLTCIFELLDSLERPIM